MTARRPPPQPEPEPLRERGQPRSPSLRRARLEPLDVGAESEGAGETAPPARVLEAFALDESASGLCVQLDAPVAPAAYFALELCDLDGALLRSEIVRVAWCTPRRGGRFNAGLEVIDGRSDVDTPDSVRLCVEHARKRQRVPVTRRD